MICAICETDLTGASTVIEPLIRTVAGGEPVKICYQWDDVYDKKSGMTAEGCRTRARRLRWPAEAERIADLEWTHQELFTFAQPRDSNPAETRI